MIKICPNCRKRKRDDKLLECPDCKCAFVDQSEFLGEYTRETLRGIASQLHTEQLDYIATQVAKRPLSPSELKHVSSEMSTTQLVTIAWHMARQPMFLMISAIALALVCLTIYHAGARYIDAKINTLDTNLTAKLANVSQNLTTNLDTNIILLSRLASKEIASAHSTITNQINDEFKTERITTIMANVASNDAKALLENDVQPTVARFRADTEFLRLATEARAYDFRAYFSLLKMSQTTNDNAAYAAKVIDEIDRSLQSGRDRDALSRKEFMQTSGTNSFSGPFSSDEIALSFAAVSKDTFVLNREGFINTVRNFKQPLFLNLLASFLTNEPDLEVADRLLWGVSELTKEDFHAHDYDRFQSWWLIHKNEYPEYPVKELTNGMQMYLRVNYSEAINFLSTVLKADSAADESRFLLVASYFETGGSNTAIQLAKGFNSADGRWARAASTKIELESGSVSNATIQLVQLVKDFPVSLIWATNAYYYHVWRKVDRPLFDRTITNATP